MMRVGEMKPYTIELIQGPPGTGKTHTIVGIVSMVFSQGAKRVHICTPSNTAADEVMLRLAKPNAVFGMTDENKDKMIS